MLGVKVTHARRLAPISSGPRRKNSRGLLDKERPEPMNRSEAEFEVARGIFERHFCALTVDGRELACMQASKKFCGYFKFDDDAPDSEEWPREEGLPRENDPRGDDYQKIYCKKNFKYEWCKDPRVKKSLFGFGSRYCCMLDGGACEFQDPLEPEKAER